MHRSLLTIVIGGELCFCFSLNIMLVYWLLILQFLFY